MDCYYTRREKQMNKNKYFITVNVFSGEDKDEPEVNVVPENITKATFKKEDRADVIRLDTPIYTTRKVSELGVRIFSWLLSLEYLFF